MSNQSPFRKIAASLIIGGIALSAVSSAHATAVSPSKYGHWGKRIQVKVDNLPSLKAGRHYEGWAMVRGKAISTGKFNVDASGRYINLDGGLRKDSIFAADSLIFRTRDYFITAEAAGDDDDKPSLNVVLSGTIKATGHGTLRGANGAHGKAEIFVI